MKKLLVTRVGISYTETGTARDLYTLVMFNDGTGSYIDPLWYPGTTNGGLSATGLYMQTIMVNTLVAAMIAGKEVGVTFEGNHITEVSLPPP